MPSRIQLLLETFVDNRSIALVQNDQSVTYSDLAVLVQQWHQKLDDSDLAESCVVGIQADFDIEAIALFLALLARGNVAALLSPQLKNLDGVASAAAIERTYVISNRLETVIRHEAVERHSLLQSLAEKSQSGFIIFSSGTTGTPKAILHSTERFLSSFENAAKTMSTLAFLLFDHIAGVDTLFYTLASKGSLAIPSARSTSEICSLIESYRLEVLPTSPSFIRLLLMSGDVEKHDLSSIKIVAFGSEPMNEAGLSNLERIFPNAKTIQKYGTSEFGSPRSKPRKDNNLWLKLDSDNCKTKIVNETLWIKSTSSMLGYLNHSQPEIIDGWMNTGDKVEVDGEWIRILGRASDIINVGGEKVYPSEVESLISKCTGVEDVLVYGEENAIMGNMVCAKIQVATKLLTKDEKKLLGKEIRLLCNSSLERFKVPSKLEYTDQSLTNARHKKVRS